MRWLLPVVACLALVQLSGCAERSFEPVASADWKPGYTWGYAVEGSVRGSLVLTEDGKVVQEDKVDGAEALVNGQMAYRVLNTQMRHEGKPLYLVAMAGDPSPGGSPVPTGPVSVSARSPGGTQLAAFRQDTLQPVTVVRFECDRCPVQVQEMADQPLQFREIPSYPWIKFPLKYQDSWSGSLFGMMKEGSGQTVQSNVRGMLTVEGPNGQKVDVVRITHALDMSGMEAMKEEALAEAREEGIQVNAFDVSQTLTAEVLYAPALHNAVVATMFQSSSLHVDFEQDGKRRVGDMLMEGSFTTRLVSYDLTEGPQVEVKDLGKAIEAPIDLPAVPGQEPTGSIRVAVDQSVVNAAEKPSVRFTTKVTGNASADSYTLYDFAGEEIASGSGGDFTFKVKEPGTYKAVVEGRDGNGRALRSSAEVVADYILTAPANCGPANVLGVPSCDALDVPVRPGIQWLEVKATRNPLAVEPGYGYLSLNDGQGTDESDTMSGNEASITIDSFEDRMLGEDWDLEYVPYVGVMEDVEYTVTLMHSQTGPEPSGNSFWDGLVEGMVPTAGPGLFGLAA